MTESAGERLERAIKKRGFGSIEIFADRCRMKGGTVRQQINRSRSTGQPLPPKAANRYAETLRIPLDWLQRGDGRDPLTGDDQGTPPARIASADERRAAASHFVDIPEYDVEAAAGGGFIVETETIKDLHPFSRTYLREVVGSRSAIGKLVVIRVRGDSMEPTLKTGDHVLVNLADTQVSQPGIFVLWDDGTIVKRIEKIPASDPPRLRVSSDNPLHGEYEALGELVKVVGRVVWLGRRM